MPTPKEVQDALAVLSKASDNPKELIQQILVGSKKIPPGWNPGTVASYYNEKCATEVAVMIDALLLDKSKDQFISHHQHNRSIRTVNQRLIQGWMYLIDHMDIKSKEYPEGIYKYARDHCEIQKDRDANGRLQGLRIVWLDNKIHPNELQIRAMTVDKVQERNQWKDDLDRWLDGGFKSDPRFQKRNQWLSGEDIEYVTRIVANSPNVFIRKITDRTIDLFYKEVPNLT